MHQQNTMNVYVLNEKKKWLQKKLSSMKLSKGLAGHNDPPIKLINDESIKKKKKNKKKLSSLNIDSDIEMQHFIPVGPVKEKRSHKDKFCTEFEQECFLGLVSSHERPVGDQPVKKKYKNKLPRKLDESHVRHKLCVKVSDDHSSKAKNRNQNRHSLKLGKEDLEVQQDLHFIDDKPVKEKMKNHKKKMAAMTLQDDRDVLDGDSNVEAVDHNLDKQKKKKHKIELPSIVVEQSDSQTPVVDQRVKEKKHKSKSSTIEPDDEEPIIKHSSRLNSVSDEIYKEKNNELLCTEVNDEVYVGQHLESLNDLPLKTMKRKRKKLFAVQQDEGHLIQHVSSVETGHNQPIKKKKRQKYLSNVFGERLLVQNDSQVQIVDDQPLSENKKLRNKQLSTERDGCLSKQEGFQIEPLTNKLVKENEKMHTKELLHTEVNDKVLMRQQDSYIDHVYNPSVWDKEKKYKNKSPSVLDGDLSLSYESRLKNVNDQLVKERKKKNKNKSSTMECYTKGLVQHDSILKRIDYNPVKEKKRHRNKKYPIELCKVHVQLDSEVEPIDNLPRKKQKKKGKNKTFCTELDKDLYVQHDLEVEPIKKPLLKKQKIKLKTKILLAECDKDLSMQFKSEVKPVDDSPFKKQKKRHRTEISTKLDKDLTMQLDSKFEPIDNPPFKKQKKRHKIITFSDSQKKCDKKSFSAELDNSLADNHVYVQESSSTEYNEPLEVQLVSQVELENCNLYKGSDYQSPLFENYKGTDPLPVNNELEAIQVLHNLTEHNVGDIFANNQCTRTVTERKEMHKSVFSTGLGMQNDISANDDFDSENSLKYEGPPFFKRIDKGKHSNQQQKNKLESAISSLKRALSHKTQSMRKKLFDIDKQQSYNNDKNNPITFQQNFLRKIPKNVNYNNYLNPSDDEKTQADLPDKHRERIVNQLEKDNAKHNVDSKFSSNSCSLNQELIDSCNVMPVNDQHQNARRSSFVEKNDKSFLLQDSFDELVHPPVEEEIHKSKLSSLEPNESIVALHDLHVESVAEKQLLTEKKKKSSSIVLDDDNHLTGKHFAHVEASSMEYVEDDSHMVVENGQQLLKESEIEPCHQSSLFGDYEDRTLPNDTDTVPRNNLLEVLEKPHELSELAVDKSCVDQHYTLVKLTEDQPVADKREMNKTFPCIEPNDKLDMQHDMCIEQANNDKKNGGTSFCERFDKEDSVHQHQENIAVLTKKLFNNDKQQIDNNDKTNLMIDKHRFCLTPKSRNIKYVDCMNQSNDMAQSDSSGKSQEIIVNQLESDHVEQDTDSNSSFNSDSSSSNKLFDDYSPMQCTVPDFDITEEPVNFEVPLLHLQENTQKLKKEERSDFNSKGVIIKMGRWSLAEDSLLKRNYENFTKHFHVNDPQLLLGIGQNFENKKVSEFRKAKHFYVRLGKDLNDRPLHNVYRRARLLFDTMRNKKRFDKEITAKLKEVHMRKGNRWQEIGNVVNKSSNTTRSAFLWHDKPVKTGVWTDKESKNLIKAIKTVAGIEDLSLVKFEGFAWENVANLVPTRNFSQCRLHWLEYLSWKLKGKKWDVKDYAKLVSILSNECYVEDYTRIDWQNVQMCFGDSSPSWQLLRKKWIYMKNKLPLENRSNFRKMLNLLSLKYS